MQKQIIKSQNDRRLFKYIKLSNDLEVLLVSDLLTQRSATSLSVGIGSKDDDVEGIAHFLEHMLFMGSTKYPNENDYNLYIKENNGMSNAFTANDHTNFYFDCVPEGLFKILDIFAQFFISSLLKEDGVNRELNAVDSEYQNSLTNDEWRFEAAKTQFMRNEHPFSKFSMGCEETLNIPDIRAKVLSFYNKYYSSHLMKLVVVGKESLEELEQNVIEMFSAIPKRIVNLNTNYGTLYEAPIHGKIVPMKDEHKLDIYWEFELDNDYDIYHIDNFLGHIVGHEGKGSLFDSLYQKFLAKSLCAGVEDQMGNKKLFAVTIHLTDIGFQRRDSVKQIVIDYLKMFSNSSFSDIQKLYNEYKKTTEIQFKNYVIPDASGFATSLTSFWTTHDINPEYLIAHAYIFNDYNMDIHKVFTNILSQMVYKNSIIFERSKLFGELEMKEEKWYKVKYIECEIDELPNNINLDLRLPYENEYICGTEIIATGINNTETPKLLLLPNMDLWWKYDTSYNTPEINLIFNMLLPNKTNTLRDRVLGKIYFKCLDHVINAELYNINCANYKAYISRSTNGFGVVINGYPEKFTNVLHFIVSSLQNLKDYLTEDLFNNIMKIYQQELENYIYTPPYNMINFELSTNIANNVYTIKDTLNTLHTILYDDLVQFDLFDTSGILKINQKKRIIKSPSYKKLYGLIQGNIAHDDAMKIGSYLSQLNTSYNMYELTEQIKETTNNEFIQRLENKDEANSCYGLSIKIGYLRPDLDEFYIEKISCLQILNEIISEQYFDQLRTKEQLGYVAQSHVYNYGNDAEQSYTTYNFCVQSSIKDAEYLRNRTMKFVVEFGEFLLNETEESINNVINSQILQLEKPFQNLKKATSYNFSVIASYCSNFNIRNDKKEYMKMINKETLINFYSKYFSLKNDTYWSMMLQSDKSSDQ